MRASRQSGGGTFTDIDIVVVSKSVKEIPGIKIVGSPQEALNYLQEKGIGVVQLHYAVDK